jgi:hypothetical protein
VEARKRELDGGFVGQEGRPHRGTAPGRIAMWSFVNRHRQFDLLALSRIVHVARYGSILEVQKEIPMLLLIIVLVLLFGGGGGYYGYSRWGSGGGMGVVGTVLLIVLLVYLFGGLRV